MLDLLWLVPILPFVGFAVLALGGRRLPHRAVSAVAVGSVGLSAVIALVTSAVFMWTVSPGNFYVQSLWRWVQVGDFTSTVGFHLDALSLTMMVVVTFVGLLIHIYSAAFMASEEGYSRFFAYMNLFVGSMLVLVLADNLLLLYLGGEGVGLCSYLLIGFWYKDRENVRAAMKAFFVTRIADTAFAVGIFLLFTSFGTLQIQSILAALLEQPSDSSLFTAAAALLLVGAIGKSAQLPLQVWLPDAMAGPTPVSALIHAATMVTAGVYLVTRMHGLFLAAPAVLFAVAILGTATLLLAGFSALVQDDIKRILAYSTVSQIGYMFLAMGVGAWSAAIYHFATHAFFKSALFLGAGVVIQSLGGEHDIFKMGGLRHRMSVASKAFMMAALTLAAIPPLTLTFNSKDLILNQVLLSNRGGRVLWVLGVVGAFLTAAYTFRMVFVVFYGPERKQPEGKSSSWMIVPFAVLAFVGAVIGLPELLNVLFGVKGFYQFLHAAMPGPVKDFSFSGAPWLVQAIYVGASLVGIGLAAVLYLRSPGLAHLLATNPLGSLLHRFLFAGWGFDWLYRGLIIRPYIWLAWLDRNDIVDAVYVGIARILRAFNRLSSLTVNGNVRWYVAAIGVGTVIVLAFVVIL
ncbi:MAG: NADH-quinone oxidoreductase subunit L [Solirubrobacterales bacterium]